MKKKTVILLAVLILAAVCLFNSVYTVEENEYGCTVRLSKIISTTDEPGLHFKVPFLDSVKSFPKATMLYDIPPSEVLTADKQNMTVDCYVLWSVSDPLKFYQSLGNTSVAEERLNALTYNALKTVMGTLSQSNIINMDDGAARNDIYEGITTSVDTLAANYGIKVEDVKIKRFDLPEELRARLEDGELDLDGMQLAAVMVSVDEQAGDFLSYGEQDVYLRADRQIYRRMEYWMESAVEEAFGISSAEYMQDDEMGALFFLIPADSSGDYQLCVQETKELPWTQIDVVDRLSVVELGEGVRNQ